jgi:hypothetical protein
VIPTLLLVGLVLGLWWRITIPLATIGWVVLLVAMGIGSGIAFAVDAALLGFINVTVGVLVFQGIRALSTGSRRLDQSKQGQSAERR